MSERLTIRLANGGVMYDNGEYWAVCYPWNEHCLRAIDRMAIKLCDLEDKIVQGDVVEVRHGHWIEHTAKPDWLEDDVEVFYNCSECGSSHWSIIPPYCPNCGAKMDGERRKE